MARSSRLLIGLTGVLGGALGTHAADSDPRAGMQRWLSRQTNLVTWSAEVTQTRNLKSVAQPLVSHGKVWFRAPHDFRWELGSPPRTIAIREPDQLTLLYPRLRRAEQYSLTAQTQGAWRSSLTLLEAGFPRDEHQLEQQFDWVSAKTETAGWVVELRPKAAEARRWVSKIVVTLEPNELTLIATALTFADGSELLNTFTNAVINPELPPGLLQADIPADYTVTRRGE